MQIHDKTYTPTECSCGDTSLHVATAQYKLNYTKRYK